MRTFADEQGGTWVADVREERTPRHHGRWYLYFQAEQSSADTHPVPEIRWQTQETGRRTIAAMSIFELRRRLGEALSRSRPPGPRPGSPAATH